MSVLSLYINGKKDLDKIIDWKESIVHDLRTLVLKIMIGGTDMMHVIIDVAHSNSPGANKVCLKNCSGSVVWGEE